MVHARRLLNPVSIRPAPGRHGPGKVPEFRTSLRLWMAQAIPRVAIGKGNTAVNLASSLALFLVLLLAGPITVVVAEPPSRAAAIKDFVWPATVPFPDRNPYEVQRAQLGLVLFFEPRLSGS
jgi:hypothetical protein